MARVKPTPPGVVLVTGAAGSSGSAVIRECARQNLPVRALVRSGPKARALEALSAVEVLEGDMARPDALAAAFTGRAASPDDLFRRLSDGGDAMHVHRRGEKSRRPVPDQVLREGVEYRLRREE